MPNQTSTKEELLRTIDEQTEVIRDLQEQLAARDAVARASAEPGWLIATRNSAYTGVTLGVKFVNGRGFVPSGKPGSKLLVDKLRFDFGYNVTEMTSSDFEAGSQPGVIPEQSFLEKVSIPQAHK